MIVFGASLSPFVRKVLAFAAEKGVTVENRPFAFNAPPAEFLEASPFRKIPALQDGDFQICDSSAIVHYIEAKHPEPALIPAEPRDRARTIWFEEYADTIMIAVMGKMFFNRVVAPKFLGRPGDDAVADAAERDELPRVLEYLEAHAPAPGCFLVGGRITLADIAVASPFANLRHMDLPLDAFPRSKAWADSMLARPSFAPWIAGEAKLLAA
jgi:glutathione S-transferase